ncbi:MAG: hypothetical protein IJF03_09935 [Lachnospiraceae bacterium]|nr:hypothetical protein [Lachnospiraceae bacterium]
MKQPKKLTREQKEIVSAHGLVANNWMFVEEVTESHIKVINKTSGKIKILDIYKKRNASPMPTKAKKHSKSV